MRTKTLLIAAAAMAVGLAASTAQVYSLNVVGYVNKTLVGGGLFTAVANPLNTTNNTLAGIFGGAGVGLPSGTQVQVWDYSLQDFVPYTKQPVGDGWSGTGESVPFAPGQAVFVKILGTDVTNTFVGEVLQGSLTNATQVNFNLIGNMVPDGGLASAIGLVPAPGSQVQKWLVGAQDFDVRTKNPIGWNAPGEPSFEVAEGFFLKNLAGSYNWVRNFTVAP